MSKPFNPALPPAAEARRMAAKCSHAVSDDDAGGAGTRKP